MMNRARLPHGVRIWTDALCEAGRLVLETLHALWRLGWWLWSLPLRLLRWCATVGVWLVRMVVISLFALLGMVVLGQFLFGMVYVLTYPWLH